MLLTHQQNLSMQQMAARKVRLVLARYAPVQEVASAQVALRARSLAAAPVLRENACARVCPLACTFEGFERVVVRLRGGARRSIPCFRKARHASHWRLRYHWARFQGVYSDTQRSSTDS